MGTETPMLIRGWGPQRGEGDPNADQGDRDTAWGWGPQHGDGDPNAGQGTGTRDGDLELVQGREMGSPVWGWGPQHSSG